jgi:hypothetical protein
MLASMTAGSASRSTLKKRLYWFSIFFTTFFASAAAAFSSFVS